MLRRFRSAQVLALALACVSPLGAEAQDLTGSGLREALRISSERAVAAVSKRDGFLQDPRLRIPLPGALGKMATGLRALGMGAKVEELEVSMNRAAERASKEATPVFRSALSKMSIQDAAGILRGSDTAATDYFKTHTSGDLRTRFQPIVAQAMQSTGLHQLYQELVGRYKRVPLASAPKLDLEGYVTQKTLDGLFVVVADEEKKIRKDPVSRTTDLLKQVFGR